MEPIDRTDARSFAASLAMAVLQALAAAGKVVLFHTILLGLTLAAISFWAASSAGLIRGVVAAVAVLAVHAVATTFVVFWATVVAAGAGVERLGVARMILAAAARRAEAADPRLREKNDYAAATRALGDAFHALETEPLDLPRGRFAGSRRLAKRVARRIVVVVARTAAKQFDLMPRGNGTVDFATLDEWLGSRIDAAVGTSMRAPAVRWLGLTIGFQVIATALVLLGAIKAPPLW